MCHSKNKTLHGTVRLSLSLTRLWCIEQHWMSPTTPDSCWTHECMLAKGRLPNFTDTWVLSTLIKSSLQSLCFFPKHGILYKTIYSLYNIAAFSPFSRLWVIVTSTTPLKLYLFDGGVVIFGSVNKKRTDVDMPADDEVRWSGIQECPVMLAAIRCQSCFTDSVRGKAFSPLMCRIRG